MEKYTIKAENIGEESKTAHFGKEYDQLEEIAERISERPDLVREDGMHILIALADEEKIITLGCVGDLFVVAKMLDVLFAEGGKQYEETNGNLN